MKIRLARAVSPMTHSGEHGFACEYHMKQAGEFVSARFIGVTMFGYWVLMCPSCFELYGTGLGPGKGHTLTVGEIQ